MYSEHTSEIYYLIKQGISSMTKAQSMKDLRTGI